MEYLQKEKKAESNTENIRSRVKQMLADIETRGELAVRDWCRST